MDKLPGRRLDPSSIKEVGAASLTFRLLETLAQNGVLSREEASAVFISAANDIRTGTEDDDPTSASSGEKTARLYETLAGWLLKKKG